MILHIRNRESLDGFESEKIVDHVQTKQDYIEHRVKQINWYNNYEYVMNKLDLNSFDFDKEWEKHCNECKRNRGIAIYSDKIEYYKQMVIIGIDELHDLFEINEKIGPLILINDKFLEVDEGEY